MLCRLARLSVVCAMAVWCAPGHAGHWDAPPVSNADFGGADAPNPTAFKTVPAKPATSAATVLTSSTGSGSVHHSTATSATSVYSQAPVYAFSQGPVYSRSPQPQFPVSEQLIPQYQPTAVNGPVVNRPVVNRPAGNGPIANGPIVNGPVFRVPQFVPPAPIYTATAQGPAPTAATAGNPPSLSQQTVPCADECSQWGLFEPVVNSGGVWGQRPARRHRFYSSSEYLFWYTRGQQFPALVTTSPAGTAIADVGRLDLPTTEVLFGASRLDATGHPGFRSTIGINLDYAGRNRLEADYLELAGENFYFERATPTDYAILARPFYNTFLGLEDAELIGYPGVADGSVTVRGETRLNGYGVRLRHSLLRCCPSPNVAQVGCGPCGDGTCGPGVCGVGYGQCGGGSPCYSMGANSGRRCWRINRLDFLAGYRNYRLEEDVSIQQSVLFTDPAGVIPLGTQIDVLDNFRTDNRFSGGEFGVDWEWTRGCWSISVVGKTAIGNMRQRACVDGFTSVWSPTGGLAQDNFGLMALESNSGSVERNRFTAIPEVGLDLFYQISANSRLRVGYTMIYMPNVIRPGGLMDTNLDPNGFPPPTAVVRFPERQWDEEDFWAQGLRVGAEFCF